MNKEDQLISQFLRNHPEVALAEIAQLKNTEVSQLILNLNQETQAIILGGLSGQKGAKVLEKIAVREAAEIIQNLPFLVAENVTRNLNIEYRQGMLELLPEGLARTLRRSLTYLKSQVGSYIDPHVPHVKEDVTVEAALNFLKAENLSGHQHLYVLNSIGRLSGYVEIMTLLAKTPNTPLKSVMKPHPSNVTSEMSVKDVLKHWNDAFFELPVTSDDGKLLGIITRQSLKSQRLNTKESGFATAKAGNALAELYLIGLTSLLGSSDTV